MFRTGEAVIVDGEFGDLKDFVLFGCSSIKMVSYPDFYHSTRQVITTNTYLPINTISTP